MALRLSDGFTAALNTDKSYYDILSNSVFEIYTGTQPSTANAAPTGTKLCTVTLASATYVPEVRATAVIALAGGPGTIDTITCGGVTLLPAATVSGTTAVAGAAAVAAINAYRNPLGITAVYTTDTITLYAPKNSGATMNGMAVTCGTTTITNAINGASADTLLNGAACTTGLTFTYPQDTKVLSMSGAWSGVAVDSGTAGWGRFICRNRKTGAADSGVLDSSLLDMRMDVTVGTSSAVAEAVVASLTVAVGATQTVNSFALTIGG